MLEAGTTRAGVLRGVPGDFPRPGRRLCWQRSSLRIGPGQFFVERVTLALQPGGRPVAHEHVEIFPAGIARPVHAFVKMFVARIKIMSLGGEPFDEGGGYIGVEKTFHFLHHGFGDPFRDEHRVAFQLRGE